MSYGVQPDGTFNKKDVLDIRDDMEQTFKQTISQDISLRPNSPYQQIIDATSIELAAQWDAAEDAHYSSFYQDASGEALDKQLALAGFSREVLRPATGEVTFSRGSPADSNITISSGTRVTTQPTETKPAIPFETQETATIQQGDTEVTGVLIKALAPWQTNIAEKWLGDETNVAANSITEFANPVSGVDAVTNPKATGRTGDRDFQDGQDSESDAEFKLRYENALAEGGVSTVPAMESSIFRFDDRIEEARVSQVRDSTQGYGPKVTVHAPDLRGTTDGPDIIAQAIFESRAAGLESFGTESGTAQSEDGKEYTENYNYATSVTVEVDVTLTTTDRYPSDGSEQIKNSLVRFIGGTDLDGVAFPGLDIGVDVIHDQVKKRCLNLPGVVEADVLIGEQGTTLGTTNITIGNLEVPTTELGLVTVND